MHPLIHGAGNAPKPPGPLLEAHLRLASISPQLLLATQGIPPPSDLPDRVYKDEQLCVP